MIGVAAMAALAAFNWGALYAPVQLMHTAPYLYLAPDATKGSVIFTILLCASMVVMSSILLVSNGKRLFSPTPAYLSRWQVFIQSLVFVGTAYTAGTLASRIMPTTLNLSSWAMHEFVVAGTLGILALPMLMLVVNILREIARAMHDYEVRLGTNEFAEAKRKIAKLDKNLARVLEATGHTLTDGEWVAPGTTVNRKVILVLEATGHRFDDGKWLAPKMSIYDLLAAHAVGMNLLRQDLAEINERLDTNNLDLGPIEKHFDGMFGKIRQVEGALSGFRAAIEGQATQGLETQKLLGHIAARVGVAEPSIVKAA